MKTENRIGGRIRDINKCLSSKRRRHITEEKSDKTKQGKREGRCVEVSDTKEEKEGKEEQDYRNSEWTMNSIRFAVKSTIFGSSLQFEK
uniref:Uncharacterized protein n=1 Tax=Pristionchus pacificus TaxID=54126 RepID=A0A2A6CQP7_PRIPA|eukprot:PDM80535.1 hypothetical protein PRIPAC_35538 [Pristionchus pacificus]